MWAGKEFHIFGAEIRKAREPNESLCRGTESKWHCKNNIQLFYYNTGCSAQSLINCNLTITSVFFTKTFRSNNNTRNGRVQMTVLLYIRYFWKYRNIFHPCAIHPINPDWHSFETCYNKPLHTLIFKFTVPVFFSKQCTGKQFSIFRM